MTKDEVGKRYGMVWVDGIDRYVSIAAAHAFAALGHHVRWYETDEAVPETDVRLPYKDD